MLIEIRTQGLSLDAAVAGLVRRQVGDALAAAAGQIRAVELHLADINGRKGGADKQCHLVLHLTGQAPLVVHDVRSELHAAIASALKRARHSLGRRLGRRRDQLSPSTLTQAPSRAGDLS